MIIVLYIDNFIDIFRAGCNSLPAVKPASEEEWHDYFSDA